MVSLTPIKTGEYPKRAKQVTAAIAGAEQMGAMDLVSPLIFGTRDYDEMSDRPMRQYHMRGYIDFSSTPVINHVIAGLNAGILACILGVEPAEMNEITGFKKVMYDGVLTPVDQLEESVDFSRVRVGAQVIESLIDQLDFSKELQFTMRIHILEFLRNTKQKPEGLPGEFVKTPTEVPVIGDWYFKPFKAGYDFSGYNAWYAERTDGNIKRMVYLNRLMSHGDGKDRLRGCLLYRIMVTPLASRPSSENNRHDTLTNAYAEVIKQQQTLSLVISGYAPLGSALSAYHAFNRAVICLLAKHDKYRANDKAVLERLVGKKGHIRNKMLGKRIDFSGRSVITIDPFMSIKDVGIPKDMIPKIYRSSILRSMQKPQLDKYVGSKPVVSKMCMRRVEETGLLDKVNVIIGRQPTLHKPSMRSFHPVPVEGRSIQLNPLCVIGFNADFDGDQMYVRVPTSKAGIKESNELLSSEQNMFLPKNGDCVVMPRQEIIYGLSVCTRENDYPPKEGGRSFSSTAELIDAIAKQEVAITSKCSCGGNTGTAGRVAFLCCINRAAFTPSEFDEFTKLEVTASSIKEIVNTMVRYDPHASIDYIDNMVRLGFTVAGTYPPRLSLFDVDVDYTPLMDNFHEHIKEDTELYNMGWETESEYDDRYTTAFEKEVDRVVKQEAGMEYSSSYSKIEADVGLNNGFVRMARSGARGSKSNLLQLYGYKGRVQNGNTGGAFRAVIEHSYLDQLTPLEHFVTAYGGRAALAQKSLSTADSGYTMRKIWHTTSPYVIETNDCGTTDGLVIGMGDIISEFTSGNIDAARSIFIDMVVGRYLAKPYKNYGADRVITKKVAKEWANDSNCSVTIRSILTCKDKCCKKCYGIDLSTNRAPAIGLPIGFIAAQSIGEPGTQLNMDAFKKGGIASSSTTFRMSGFSKLNSYTECKELTKDAPSYDPVAWATGEVMVYPKTDGTKQVKIVGAKGSVILPINVPVKSEVKQGEGLRAMTGDKNVSEIMKYVGLLAAQRYLCYALYSVYKDEGAVNLKHFEVLTEAMTMYRVITTDQKSLVPGLWHDSIMLRNANLSETTYTPAIKPVHSVQGLRPYALSRIAMEQIRDGLASSVLLALDDPLTYPFNRVLVGKSPWVHDAYKYHDDTNDFIEQRRL